jgi:hypothetical protein
VVHEKEVEEMRDVEAPKQEYSDISLSVESEEDIDMFAHLPHSKP